MDCKQFLGKIVEYKTKSGAIVYSTIGSVNDDYIYVNGIVFGGYERNGKKENNFEYLNKIFRFIDPEMQNAWIEFMNGNNI